ncbi:MAG: HAD family phosphatase [Bacteroidales bacterium]|nr:HAD family phosphatase [Bacteroidales bacterium]
MVKGLIFDMDGTMVDNSALHIEAFRLFFERHGCKEPFSEEWFARRNEDILKHYIPRECEKYGWVALSDEKEMIYRETFKDVIKPVDGLLQLLEQAVSEGMKCCVGSSAPRQNVEFHLDVLGARKFMSDWLCMEDVKIGKPDPDVYLKCCSRIDCDPSECIVFEDATAGVEAGLRAGCKVVGIANWNDPRKLIDAGAHLVVKNFTELTLPMLRAL